MTQSHLARLVLRDFVLASQVAVEWTPGFCVVSGETGAGKSLLVGALSLLRGGRAGGQVGKIRPGAKQAEVEAVFCIAADSDTGQWLQEQGLDCDIDEGESDDGGGTLTLIARRVLKDGKSSAFLNGRQVANARLSEVISPLMDICGQHAHTALQQTGTHRRLLDSFAGNGAEREAVATAYRTWHAAAAALAEARAAQTQRQAERQRLQAIVEDFAGFDFTAARWREMNDLHHRTTHAADLLAQSAAVQQLLDGSGGEPSDAAGNNAEQSLVEAQRTLAAMVRADASVAETHTTLTDVLDVVRGISRDIARYAEQLQTHPEAQAEAEAFLADSHRFARKYQLPDPLLLESFIAEARAAFEALQSGADDAQLAEQTAAYRAALDTAAGKLTASRTAAAESLAAEVNGLLAQLAMAKAVFSVELLPLADVSESGSEQVQLCIQTRANMPAHSIGKVASGGELSRLNLALQLVCGHATCVSVFDEVDAGISGAVADVIGQLLQRLAANKQVICITHLPQVAAHAHNHWRVAGAIDQDASDTMAVEHLSKDERIEELARLQSGSEITATARAHAKSLLATAHA